MSERNKNLASDLPVGKNRKPDRKEPKQISFRVSESEYEKLKRSAENLHMSVPAFVKKKAQGARLVAPKFDAETSKEMVQQLSKLGGNVNQIAKYCNERRQHNEDPRFFDLERNLSIIRKELKEIWQQLK